MPAKLEYNGVMFAGGVVFCVVPHLTAIVTRAPPERERYAAGLGRVRKGWGWVGFCRRGWSGREVAAWGGGPVRGWSAGEVKRNEW